MAIIKRVVVDLYQLPIFLKNNLAWAAQQGRPCWHLGLFVAVTQATKPLQ